MIVLHAYDESLRASKEKEQQLHSQLATLQQESQVKEQQLSILEIENNNLLKKIGVENELNDHLKRLQKGNQDTLLMA